MKGNFKRKIKTMILFAILTIIVSTTAPQQVSASSDIKVIIDGKEMITDTSPIIVNSRTLVPFAAIFENLGSTDVEWLNPTREVKASIGNIQVRLKIDDNKAYINNKMVELDVAATIRNGRTLVPLRFIAESTGDNEVIWNNDKREVHITTSKHKQESLSITNKSKGKSFRLGESAENLVEKFGQPDRRDLSELGFTWYVYNKDLANYFQVGVKDNKLVAFGSNSTNWEYNGFKVGSKDGRLKVDRNQDRFEENGYTATILVDEHKNDIVSTISISYLEPYDEKAEYNKQVNDGMARQLHDLVNVYRHRNNKKPLEINTKLVEMAEYHSKDMANNNFFSHQSFNGDEFIERTFKFLGKVSGAGENISAGYQNALFSADGLYNSLGHRENMLNQDYRYSGTGVQNSKRAKPYYTQVFLRGDIGGRSEDPSNIELREGDEFGPWEEWD